ncbi:hypothetical protein HHI36_021119 [Cryptolaemus montrouzieri]|uniref:Uncharacterized protein n=1 Tax=Cryptolaemus montrouzieri TaxID=559131 RepID=A0ABD2MWU4_9CUCU
MKKFYEKDSLPPCLRARNLKNQMKTRSLDEEEFKKECGLVAASRRKSLDESMGYKTNSLPKMLNQPKTLPLDGSDREIDSLHLSHSSENIVRTVEEEKKKRERIEKYKEERRKILQEKYRTESFKEDKDVLLSKLKIYKSPNKEDSQENIDFYSSLTRTRRKSARSDDSVNLDEPKTPPDEKNNQDNLQTVKPNSLKARAAVFERNSNGSPSKLPKPCKKPGHVATTKDNRTAELNAADKVFRDGGFVLRSRTEDVYKNERRRHTYESRERESEAELRLRRGSLEHHSPRKEKAASPSYCIKDMKAIFESKSKQ